MPTLETIVQAVLITIAVLIGYRLLTGRKGTRKAAKNAMGIVEKISKVMADIAQDIADGRFEDTVEKRTVTLLKLLSQIATKKEALGLVLHSLLEQKTSLEGELRKQQRWLDAFTNVAEIPEEQPNETDAMFHREAIARVDGLKQNIAAFETLAKGVENLLEVLRLADAQGKATQVSMKIRTRGILGLQANTVGIDDILDELPTNLTDFLRDPLGDLQEIALGRAAEVTARIDLALGEPETDTDDDPLARRAKELSAEMGE